MTDRSNYIKIRVGKFMPKGDEIYADENGKLKASPEFSEILHEADSQFREPIITFINDEIGLHNWSVKFNQFDTDGKIYDVRISCNTDEEAIKIKSIIIDKIKGLQFNWLNRSDLS